MQDRSKSQKARYAIRSFKVLADAIVLQGVYSPSGKVGEKLADALKQLSPEIYGSMNDNRIFELKGLEYVVDRMPRGIENCSRIILTAQEDFQNTSFERVVPLKRRRVSYAVSSQEMCFVITTGQSEIYDILTHITFLNIEAQKLLQHVKNPVDGVSAEWAELERMLALEQDLRGEDLEQAIWNLSIILGRTYRETRETYDYLEQNRHSKQTNNGLFRIVYGIGRRVLAEQESKKNKLCVYFTPALQEVINQHKYGATWATSVKNELYRLQVQDRPIHIISANMHSMRNLIYGAGVFHEKGENPPGDIYTMVKTIRDRNLNIEKYAQDHGFTFINDESGANIDINVIDLSQVDIRHLHPDLRFNVHLIKEEKPVLLVIDYAFGTQAFEIMDELLNPMCSADEPMFLRFESISIMGKAGVLPGKKGDIMLATSHVMEGTADNYRVDNDLHIDDFGNEIEVFVGPVVTVLGTSLQNRDVLERFLSSSWRAVGLEMEGGHYQRAISAAIIQGHIPASMKTRYAYYASDNPMVSGQTLASGPMGDEGIVPTYLISKVILEKITNYDDQEK